MECGEEKGLNEANFYKVFSFFGKCFTNYLTEGFTKSIVPAIIKYAKNLPHFLTDSDYLVPEKRPDLSLNQ